MELSNKVCLVTGGTSGIGASVALACAENRCRLALVSRTGEIPKELGRELDGTGVSYLALRGDVSISEDCVRVVQQAAEHFGQLDFLVNSAGGPAPGSLVSLTEEAWMNAFAVHVHSNFYLCKAAVPHLAASGGGAIIMLASAAGLRGCLGALAYGVAKGALPQFARSLAREVADQNVRVNCVSPGVIRTPFQNFLTPEQAENNVRNRIPLHREGKPEDVAAAILMLLRNEFITGENLVIDGGMTMRIA